MLKICNYLCDPLLSSLHWTHPRFSTFLFYWRGQKWKLHPKCGLTSAEQKGGMSSLKLLAILCPVQPRHQLFVTGVHCWLISPWCLPGPSCPFSKAVFQLPMAVPHQLQDFALPHVALHDTPVCSTTLWYTSHSSSFVSTAQLLRVHPAPLSRSLKKTLNRTGPRTNSWDTLASK